MQAALQTVRTEMSAERERLLQNINEEVGLAGDEAMPFRNAGDR